MAGDQMFPTKVYDEILSCTAVSRVSWFHVNNQKHLFCIAWYSFQSGSQYVSHLIVKPWGKESTTKIVFKIKKTVQTIFWENVYSNYFFVDNDMHLHSFLDYCFDSWDMRDSHVIPGDNTIFKVIPYSAKHDKKCNTLSCHFNFCLL